MQRQEEEARGQGSSSDSGGRDAFDEKWSDSGWISGLSWGVESAKNSDAIYLEGKDIEEQVWRGAWGAGASNGMGGVSIEMGWETLCSECREKRGRERGKGGGEEGSHRGTWKETSEKGETQMGAQ